MQLSSGIRNSFPEWTSELILYEMHPCSLLWTPTVGTGKLKSMNETKTGLHYFLSWLTPVYPHANWPEECAVEVSTSLGGDVVLGKAATCPCLPR